MSQFVSAGTKCLDATICMLMGCDKTNDTPHRSTPGCELAGCVALRLRTASRRRLQLLPQQSLFGPLCGQGDALKLPDMDGIAPVPDRYQKQDLLLDVGR